MFGSDVKGELNKSEYVRRFKERVHMSKSKMDMYSSAEYIGVGSSFSMRYDDESERRYIAAPNLTYDVVVSLFDVNSRNIMACRAFQKIEFLKKDLSTFIGRTGRNGKLEARVIGMQNNYEDFYPLLDYLAELFVSKDIKLVEIDLFGNNTRHIAIDSKLGTTYNILMENRLYRAGELINKMTLENFQKALMQSRETNETT